MIKASDVRNLKVITVDDGRVIENVDDVMYDPGQNRVVALIIKDKGIFSDGRVILTEDIRKIGTDAVIIDSAMLVKKMSDIESVKSISKESTYLTATKIVSEDGMELGSISDLYFDPETGEVQEFEVSQGGIKNLKSGKKKIRVDDIVTVGKDATIVKGYTDEMFAMQGQAGGVQGAFNQGSSNTTNFIDQTKMKLSDLTASTKDKVQDLRSASHSKIDEYQNNPDNQRKYSDAQLKASQTKDTLKEKTSEATDTIKTKWNEFTGKIQDDKKSSAVGKYLTKNILDHNDQVLAARGDMVTHQLLTQAENLGIVDQILQNVSNDPLVLS